MKLYRIYIMILFPIKFINLILRNKIGVDEQGGYITFQEKIETCQEILQWPHKS